MKSPESYRILVIDDNQAIHNDLREILQPESRDAAKIRAIEATLLGRPDIGTMEFPDFQIDSAYQGEPGFTLIQEAIKTGHPYAMALIDIYMPPGWDGIETINHIFAIDKDIQIALCISSSDNHGMDAIKRLGNSDRLLILKKPFDKIEMQQLVCTLTKKWELTQQAKKQQITLEQEIDTHIAELRATLDANSDGILTMTQDGVIHNFNQKFIDIWDISPHLLKYATEKELQEIIAEKIHHPDLYLAQTIKLSKNNQDICFEELKCKNGKFIECYSQPQKIDDTHEGRIWCYRDITQLKELELQLAYQATHDNLTGLPNRSLLLDRLNLAITNANRTNTHIAVLFFDLDRFKEINDAFGHHAADKVLQEIAKRLGQHVRESDTIARLSGDEFVMIITALEKEEHALSIARVCANVINQPLTIENQNIHITTSIGISIYPKDGEDINTLLRNANIAMYRAKEAATDLPAFHTKEMNVRVQERLTLENNLQNALKRNEFLLYYQPLINLNNGAILGAEALLRWQHPKLGIIPPLEFISLAEEIGLILPISEWVFRAACTQLAQWQKLGLPNLTMAINISTLQLQHKNFIEIIKHILNDTNVNPKHLDLEFTEEVLVQQQDNIHIKLKDIKELGIHLVIDDFGAGCSSLRHLKLFLIDKVKIDRSVVHYISPDPEDTSIIYAIMAVAKALKLHVSAEGIETEEQLNFLRNIKCREGQGYYFSKPLSATHMTELLRNKKPLC